MSQKPLLTPADEPHVCPHCTTSLLGEPIPRNIREHYSGNYWKREVGYEDPDLYDGIYYYTCPDCRGEFGGARALAKS